MSTRAVAPTLAAAVSVVAPVQRPMLQRSCDCGQHTSGGGECEDCKKKKKMPLQRYASGAAVAPIAPPIVHDVLRSPGQPLDEATRAFMEPRFRQDFSQVRVHTDEWAAESARAVSAHAYTVGRHVVFGRGQYFPAGSEGLPLLAHELTHVVQQRFADSVVPQNLIVGQEGDEYENQAQSFANALESGSSLRTSPLSVRQSRLQRIGFGHQILRFFGIESGSFSEGDLTEYLDRVTKNGKCDCGLFDFLSDDKARQIANQSGVGSYKLNQDYKGFPSTDLKRILIQEMLSGPTTGSDELAIIKILQDSDGNQILEILDPANGLSMQALDNSVGGKNHDLLVQVLEEKLPQVGSAHLKRSANPDEKSGACTADRAVKLHHAQKRAEAAVTHTIELMDKYSQKPKDYQQVGRFLQCYFSGADAAKAAAIRDDVKKIGDVLNKIRYICPAEPFKEFKVTDSTGKTIVFTCEDDTQARAMVEAVASANPAVLFCPDYFGLPPRDQASIVIHEAAHHARQTIEDITYGPKCEGLPADAAMKNADSYAYFVMALEKDGLRFDMEDCPMEWKTKIVAATRTAQLWVNVALSKVEMVMANPKSPDPTTARQLEQHFNIKDASSKDVAKVQRALTKIQAAFGSEIPFTCVLDEAGPGDEDLVGKVIWWPIVGSALSNIRVYRRWFELDDIHQAITIVHEAAHKYAGKGEQAYYEHQFNTYRKLSTDDLLDNADSFAQFARYVQ